MAARDAQVSTADLEAALDYLEGLQLILASFHIAGRGMDAPDPILDALQAMDWFGMSWEPLRYQDGIGEGWSYVAKNVASLRERLLEGYSDAAL